MCELEIILTILSLIVGLCVGSFLNVCIYRIPNRIFFSKSRSFCPKCRTKLRGIDNIPVLSYIFLKGKCHFCHEKISLRYPIIELLNGLLWMFIFIKFRINYITLIYMLVVSILIVAMMIDYDTMEIPDTTHVLILLLALLSFIPNIDSISYKDKLIGMVAISVPTFILALFGAMGLGDVKLFFVLGLLLGWKYLILIFFLSAIIALIGSIITIIIKRKSKTINEFDSMDEEIDIIKDETKGNRHEIPFGPYIALATFLVIFIGEYVIDFYVKLIG